MFTAINETISSVGLSVIAFLFVIGVIVFFHELGHFFVARLFKVKIETFSIGFGREIFGWTDKFGTRWKISWLPVGGYVKFFGDADETSRPGDARNVPSEMRKDMLQFKPLWQRALVVAAGPLANFVLAIAIFASLALIAGAPAEPPVIAEISANSAAMEAGLRVGDEIRAIDGKPVTNFLDLQRIVVDNAGHNLTLTIMRGDASMNLSVTPHRKEIKDRLGHTQAVGIIGITNRIVALGPIGALSFGASETWYVIDQNLQYIGGLFTGRESVRELSSVVGIAKVSGDVAQLGIIALVNLIALLSAWIGMANLFPIPILDGGHLLYYGFEAVLGRPLGARAQEVGFRLGLALVLSLVLFATFNDLVRFNLF